MALVGKYSEQDYWRLAALARLRDMLDVPVDEAFKRETLGHPTPGHNPFEDVWRDVEAFERAHAASGRRISTPKRAIDFAWTEGQEG